MTAPMFDITTFESNTVDITTFDIARWNARLGQHRDDAVLGVVCFLRSEFSGCHALLNSLTQKRRGRGRKTL